MIEWKIIPRLLDNKSGKCPQVRGSQLRGAQHKLPQLFVEKKWRQTFNDLLFLSPQIDYCTEDYSQVIRVHTTTVVYRQPVLS